MTRAYELEFPLKYGCNPHQLPAGMYRMSGGSLPFKVCLFFCIICVSRDWDSSICGRAAAPCRASSGQVPRFWGKRWRSWVWTNMSYWPNIDVFARQCEMHLYSMYCTFFRCITSWTNSTLRGRCLICILCLLSWIQSRFVPCWYFAWSGMHRKFMYDSMCGCVYMMCDAIFVIFTGSLCITWCQYMWMRIVSCIRVYDVGLWCSQMCACVSIVYMHYWRLTKT